MAAVCSTGAQALAGMGELGDGIVICGPRFVDMMYAELLEYLPEGFEMLLIAGAAAMEELHLRYIFGRTHSVGMTCPASLVMPFKVHELLEAVDALEEEIFRRKKRMRNVPKEKSARDRQIIEQAKALMMEQKGCTEEEAHRYLQKRSMDNGTGIVEVAQMLLRLLQEESGQ